MPLMVNLATLLCLLGYGSAEEIALFSEGAASKTITLSGADFKSKVTYDFSVKAEVLHGGKQEGTLLVTATTPTLTLVVSPSRGMNIISGKATTKEMGAIDLAWSTPIEEVINPIYINQFNRNGSGFLEGFRETVVRCGFEWIGHAGVDNGEMLTLHGLSSATPASRVSVEPTKEGLMLRGVMYQTATKQVNFMIESTLQIFPDGAPRWAINDRLYNGMDYPHEFQALYHSNFGPPFLEEGASLSIAATKVEPFNAAAVSEIDTWNNFKGPTRDYDETVYNIWPLADEKGMGLALLHNSDDSLGVAVAWDTGSLPVFGLWKNTDVMSRGYVTGLEPGTGFSYNRRFNRELGLVKSLAGKSDITFSITYTLHSNAKDIKAVKDKIADIQGSASTTISRTPSSDEKIDRDGLDLHQSLVIALLATAATYGTD